MSENAEQEIKSLIQKAKRSGEQGNWLTNLFVTPDHHRSAELYNDAGHKLKFLDRNKESAECYLNAGDEYLLSKCSGNLFFAAEVYSNSYALSGNRAVLIKACNLYCMNNSYSLAANCRKHLLEEEKAGEAVQSLDFIIMCYDKAGMRMNRLSHVEKKGIVCARLGRYGEAGDCFRECEKPLYAFLTYFLDGNEKKMKELDFENEVSMSFYGGNRVKDATEAISKYEAHNGIRDEYKELFNSVLERLKPEHDIL